jgi:hypothetical protein
LSASENDNIATLLRYSPCQERDLPDNSIEEQEDETDGAYLDLLYNEVELVSLAEDNDDIDEANDDTSANNDSDSSKN